jgi:hypothetical protein
MTVTPEMIEAGGAECDVGADRKQMLRRIYKAMRSKDPEIEHLQSQLNAATEALRPFAALAGKFSDCVVEICAPHPENPSPRIEPFDTRHFDAALKTVGSMG